jgi:hypothetical protein
MPMWRCPHCGTPQAETSRCWVCKRSSTSCGTCRHFRRSVAAQLGYCGLDRRRSPLHGDEIRPCWEASSASEPADDDRAARDRTPAFLARGPAREQHRRLEFVPVDPAGGLTGDASIPAGRETLGWTADVEADRPETVASPEPAIGPGTFRPPAAHGGLWAEGE